MIKVLRYVFIVLSFFNSGLLGETPKHFSKYFVALKKNVGDLEFTLNDLSNYMPLMPPHNKFYADPMLFKHKGVNYLFFEDFDYRKGRIAYVNVDEELNLSAQKIVLDLPHHVSFPYIFSEGDKIYMVPETAASLQVMLFEAVQVS